MISFQRSPEESRRAIQLLEASAHSASIRELLTTPLQAHILAVVVRDGERPPDRRWKLYARFYDVIRRREANRNSRAGGSSSRSPPHPPGLRWLWRDAG